MDDGSWLLAAAAVAAGMVKGFTGFGGSLVMAPLFLLVLGPGPALGTVVAVNLATAWQLLTPAWRNMRRSIVLPMAAVSALATPLGVAAALTLDPLIERRAVGLAVLASGLALMAGWRRSGLPRPAATAAVGAAGGVLNGLAGIGGPPAAVWLLSGRDGALRDRAGLIVYVALTQAATAVVAAAAGALDLPALKRALLLAPLHVAGTAVGARLFRMAPERVFRLAAAAVIVGLGLVTALR